MAVAVTVRKNGFITSPVKQGLSKQFFVQTRIAYAKKNVFLASAKKKELYLRRIYKDLRVTCRQL